MMNKVATMAAFAVLCSAGMLWAEDVVASKEVTLKGTMTCGKCELKITDRCRNVLKVTEDGKEVNYLLDDNKVSKDAHGMVCQKAKENVSVTGVVAEKDGKKVIAASKIE